ncbi:MAG TPA: hypothetical protein VK932_18080 [Kofleriaceae bacterium]|nr:hypothetical protein [Kofleriaceae bacterium]
MTRAAPREPRAGLALALAGALAAAACTSASSSPTPPPAPAREIVAARPGTAALLGSLAALVGQVADPAQLAGWAQQIDAGEAPLGGYLDEILRTERFAAEVVPALVFGAFVNVRNYYAVPSAFVLKRAAEPGAPLHLATPCPASEATLVAPWWNLGSEVRVCPDAYRPGKWTLAPGEHSYKTSVVLSCDSQIGSPELEGSSPCGCGPNLIRCLRDEDQYNELNQSLMDEVKRTTAYVVEHDLPMAALFTGNSTFRDRNVELYYRRQKIGALQLETAEKELASLGAWPARGKWAPRAELRPGQHAGLLTAPQILHWLPDRRQRQRAYYEIMWCNLRNSFGATTHKVLELNANGNNFFVHDSWKKLAHTELCTSCHARLDYGSQFFQGYLDSRASTHFHPALQTTARGPLYGQDINDLRGEAPLTPLGFAKLATDQPDFKQCMTSHLVSYVLGGRATGDDVRAIDAAVEGSRTFRASMKVALERYAARWREGAGAPVSAPDPSGQVAAASPGPGGPGDGVTVGPALRARLDRHCVDCHDRAPYADTADTPDLPFALTGGVLPRSLVVSMTDQVAFGLMPKDQALDPALREDLVGLLIDALWADPAARVEARRYYLGRARGLPAQQIDNALHAISQVARAPSDLAWGAFERGIWSDQSSITPGFLAVTGLEAVRACARARESGGGAKLEDCLRRALSLNILSRWPP